MIKELLPDTNLPDMVFTVQAGDGAGIPAGLHEGSGLMRTEAKRDTDLMWIPRSLMDWGREARKGLEVERCKPGSIKIWQYSGGHQQVVVAVSIRCVAYKRAMGQCSRVIRLSLFPNGGPT